VIKTFKQHFNNNNYFLNYTILLLILDRILIINFMIKVKDIADYIESKVPLEFQEDYDNSGLILGNPQQEVRAVLLCLDITGQILDEAISNKCNMIISHHPLIFKGIKKLIGSDSEQRLIIKAIENNIAIYALHTNLDNSYDGLNALLCNKLGIINYKILQPSLNQLNKLVTFCPHECAEKVRMSLFKVGAGHIGNYDCCSFNSYGQGTFRASNQATPFVGEKNKLHFEDETRIEVVFPSFLETVLISTLIENHPYEEVAYDIFTLKNRYEKSGAGVVGDLEHEKDLFDFLRYVKEVTGTPVIRHTIPTGKKVKRVALCSGSGNFLIQQALNEQADLFLTADLKYHDFFKPQGDLVLADIGHYESEQFVKEWIYAVLIKKFSTFAVLISETNTNPVKYY
jgi:dinuclear metal center YbgI/SA1388 family protein